MGGARYAVKIRLPHAVIMTFLFRSDLSTTKKLHVIRQAVVEHATNLAAFATLYKTILALLKYTSRHLSIIPSSSTTTTPRLDTSIWRMIGRTILSMIVHGPFPGETTLLQTTTDTSPDGAAASPLLPPPGYPEQAHHALLAGAVGGYFVWGRDYQSSVNYQLLLYLTSRVLVGVWKRLQVSSLSHHHHHDHHDPSSIIQQQDPPWHRRRAHILYRCMSAVVWGLVMVLFEESPHVLQSSLRNSMDEIYRQQPS
jgi:hypothetical protein